LIKSWTSKINLGPAVANLKLHALFTQLGQGKSTKPGLDVGLSEPHGFDVNFGLLIYIGLVSASAFPEFRPLQQSMLQTFNYDFVILLHFAIIVCT
jgi:hypothetical protein